MAASRPTGTATARAISEVRNVALARTMMPKCLSAKSGVHWVSVRKSHSDTSRKNAKVSKIRTAMMPIVVRMEIRLDPSRAAWSRASRILRPRRPAGRNRAWPVLGAARGWGVVRRAGNRKAGTARSGGDSGGGTVLLRFPLQELTDRHPDQRSFALEQRTRGALLETPLHELVGIGREGDVAHLAHQLRRLVRVGLDEGLDQRRVGNALLDIDE